MRYMLDTNICIEVIRKRRLFLALIDILDYPAEAAQHYARVRSALGSSGAPIEPNDALIAAHCFYSSCVLVTNNTRKFKRVPGLIVQNWTR